MCVRCAGPPRGSELTRDTHGPWLPGPAAARAQRTAGQDESVHMHLQNTESSFYICEFSPERERINILLMCIKLYPSFLFLGTCTYKARRYFLRNRAGHARRGDPGSATDQREKRSERR